MIGEMLGAYQILRRLGAGGMGEVYLAEHTRIARRAAIKLLLPEYSNNAAVVERFFTEARATSLIRHPGIVEILDCDVHSSGRAYIVMELLEGESLRDCLRRVHNLAGDLPAVRAIGCQVAEALAAAHDMGIIHRDIKPDNIFLAMASHANAPLRVKVVDFGIAKLASEVHGGVSHTQTGSMLGTPVYMSPEQCRGAGKVDHRTDIYSLGCVFFEMLCGRTPFMYEGAGELILAHLSEIPVRASSVQPLVPPGLDQLIADMLAKNPDERPQSLLEVVQRLTQDAGEAQSSTMFLAPVPALPGHGVPSAPSTHAPSSRVGMPIAMPTSPSVETAGMRPMPSQVGALGSRVPSVVTGGVGPQPTPGALQGTRILLPSDQHHTTLSNTAAELRRKPQGGGAFDNPEPIPDEPPHHTRKPLVIGAVVGALAIAGVVIAVAVKPPPQSDQPPKSVTATAQNVTPPPKPKVEVPPVVEEKKPVAAPRRVVAKLISSPAGAEVFIGEEDTARGKTPLGLEIPASDEDVKVVLKLDGYKPHEMTVSAQESSEKEVRLQKLKQHRPPRGGGHSSSGSQLFAPIED